MNSIDETVTIDYDLIQSGESGNGGWNKKQLALIGVSWPPKKGWKHEVIGNIISYSDAIRFIEFKNKKSDKKQSAKKTKKNKPIFVKVKKKLSWNEQYKHPNWQKLRLTILNRDNFTCCKCGDNQSQLHVHHLKYEKNKNIWGVKHSDLITLCEKCHLKEHKTTKFK